MKTEVISDSILVMHVIRIKDGDLLDLSLRDGLAPISLLVR